MRKKALGEVHRYLAPTGLQLTAVDVGAILDRSASFAFVALPHGASMPIVRGLIDGGLRIVDVGADFRFSDAAAYERAYGPHAEPALLAEAVYGLIEHARAKVAKARLVANPGCYPTGALMGLVPIADLVEGTVFVDSKSGTSGAGRSAATNQLFAEVTENLRPYSLWKHRHQPEIQEKLSLAGGRTRVLFAPHLLPTARGLLSACYFATPAGAEIGRRLEAAYRSEPFVRVLPRGTWPELRNVRGTNLVEIGWQLQGIAGKGDTLFYLMDDNDGDIEKVYAIDLVTENILFSFDVPDPSGQAPRGLAWDGTFFWLLAEPVGASSGKQLFKYDLGGSGTPGITVPVTTINFPNTTVGNTNNYILTIYSTGTAALTLDSITVSGSNFSFNPLSFPINIPAGSSQNVTVNFTPTNYAFYQGLLKIYCNDPVRPVQTTLTFVVRER